MALGFRSSFLSAFRPFVLSPICLAGVSHMGVSHRVFFGFCFVFPRISVCKFLNPQLIEVPAQMPILNKLAIKERIYFEFIQAF